MKNFTIILILSFLFTTILSAQEIDVDNYSFEPNIQEGENLMSQGTKNAYSIVIEGVSKKDVEKEWGKFIKSYKSKSKYDKKKKEFFADNVEVKSISENTMDVYAQVSEVGQNTELTVWFDLGGAYLSSEAHADMAPGGNAWIGTFAKRMENKRVTDFHKSQEKVLKGMNKDFKNLKKDKEKLEKDIANYEKKIEEAKKKIEENVKMQGEKEAAIKAQTTKIGKIDQVLGSLKE